MDDQLITASSAHAGERPLHYRSHSLDWVNGFAGVLLIATLVIAPWLLGGRPAWARWGLSLLVCLTSVACLAGSLINRKLGQISPVLVAIVALMLLGLLQQIPTASPSVSHLNHALLSQQIPYSSESELESLPAASSHLTVAPNQTWNAIYLYSLSASVFVITSLLSSRTTFVRTLYYSLAINGMILSLFGVYQKVRWNNVPFGIVDLEYGGQPFASFINRNNASCYLLLCFAAGLALLLRLRSRNRKPTGNSWKQGRDDETQLIVGVGLGIIAAGILASLSRSGVVSLVTSVLIIVPLVVKSRRGLMTAIGGLIAWALVVSVTGWFGASLARFLEIGEDSLSLGRLDHWAHTFPGIWDFLWTGAGLGTYSTANRPYQSLDLWFTRADNQYVEFLLEGGLLGGLILAAGVGGLFWYVKKLTRSTRLFGIGESACILLIFILASQLVHALFDFGIVLPAAMMTASALCALGTSRYHFYASLEASDEPSDDANNGKSPLDNIGYCDRRVAIGCLGCVLIVQIFAALHWYRESLAESIAQNARSLERLMPHPQQDLLLADLQRRIEAFDTPHPLVLQSQSILAERAFRTQMASLLNPATPDFTRQEWSFTGFARLTLTTLGKSELTSQLRQMIQEKGLRRILVEQETSELAEIATAPMSGLAWDRLMYVRWMLNSDQKEVLSAASIAALLRPFDVDTQLTYAMLLANYGEHQQSQKIYRHLTELPNPDWNRIWSSARQFYGVEMIAEELIPEKAGPREQLLQIITVPEDRIAYARWLLKNTSPGTEKRNLYSPDLHYLRGRSHAILGQHEEAISNLQEAVDTRPLSKEWRLQFCELLIHAGQNQLAREYLEKGSRIHPGDPAIERLYQKSLQGNSKPEPVTSTETPSAT